MDTKVVAAMRNAAALGVEGQREREDSEEDVKCPETTETIFSAQDAYGANPPGPPPPESETNAHRENYRSYSNQMLGSY